MALKVGAFDLGNIWSMSLEIRDIGHENVLEN